MDFAKRLFSNFILRKDEINDNTEKKWLGALDKITFFLIKKNKK